MDTGLLVGARVLCPWHNAAFSVITGAGIDMPARDALDSYPVEVRHGAPLL
jgi:nitrite reductase/ring-hydroxylating ferredoxin subunit